MREDAITTSKIIYNRNDFASLDEMLDFVNQQTNLLVKTNHIYTFSEDAEVKGKYYLIFAPKSKIRTDEDMFPVWVDGEQFKALNQFTFDREIKRATEELKNLNEANDIIKIVNNAINEKDSSNVDDVDKVLDTTRNKKKGGNNDA